MLRAMQHLEAIVVMAAFAAAIGAPGPAAAQQPAPASAAQPQPMPGYGQPSPADAARSQPPPGPYGPAPATQPPPPPTGNGAPAPAGYGPPPPAGYGQPAPAGYAQPAPAAYVPPPTPTLELPDFSVRLDPINAIIDGQLGLELEVAIPEVDWLSVELAPEFVIMQNPPSYNITGQRDNLRRRARGIGPISGASVGAGFWFGGDRPLDGYVVRLQYQNLSYRYIAESLSSDPNLPVIGDGWVDTFPHTQRRVAVMFGSSNLIGKVFTIASGIGIGYELNQKERCFEAGLDGTPAKWSATSDCDDEVMEIGLDHWEAGQTLPRVDLTGPFHPFYLFFRLSFGVTIDL